MINEYSFCVYTSDFKCKVEEVIKEEGYSNISVVDNKEALLRLGHINFLFVCKDKNRKIPKYIKQFKKLNKHIKTVCVMETYDPYLTNEIISKGCDGIVHKTDDGKWIEELVEYIDDFVMIEENEKCINNILYRKERRRKQVITKYNRRFADIT